MRLLDEIINKGIGIPPDTVVITADAVARHLYEEMPESLDLRLDFPNIAPPFERMAVEWLVSGKTRDGRDGKIVSAWIPHRQVTVAQSMELKPGYDPATMFEGFLAMFRAFGNEWGKDETWLYVESIRRYRPRWVSFLSMFDELLFERLNRKPMGSAVQFIEADGSAMRSISDPENHLTWVMVHPIFTGRADIEFANSMFYAYFLTMSFMHCKNVELRDVANDPNFVRRFTKWNKRPPVQYKELVIQPMQKIIRRTAEEQKTGIRQAMHICRGHFKDYRQRGLFGKLKDIFWWDQTVRGSEDEGTIHKSYNVKSPSK